MGRQLKKTHCSSPKAHSSHLAILDQTPNQVHVLSPPLFFKFCWFQLCLLMRAQLPAMFVFPPGTAFQAFGRGLLNSRLLCFICWTLHRTIHGVTPLVASLAKELQLFWAPAGSTCPSLPRVTWRHCACRLYGVLSDFSSIQHLLYRLRGCSFLSGSCSICGVLLWFKTQNGEGQSQLSERKV